MSPKKQANMLDDLLERATAALRDVEPADGPPAGVVSKTVAALDTARRPFALRVAHRIGQGVFRMNPLARLATAAAIALAVGAVGFWNLGQGGAGLAFGDVLAQVRQVRTVRYKQVVVQSHPDGPPETTVAEVIIVAPSLVRTTRPNGYTTIADSATRRHLAIIPKTREAVLREAPELPEGITPAEPTNALDDLNRLDEGSAHCIGVKDLDGRTAVVFEVDQGRETVWIDPVTRLPMRIERTARPEMMPNLIISVTMSDFTWDMPVDPSLVSLTPPAGYRVITHRMDLRSDLPGEPTLIDGLRIFAEAHDGRFPDSLDYGDFAGRFGKTLALARTKKTQISQEEILQLTTAFTAVCSAGNFAGSSDGTDWHYAGKGTRINQPSTPILWYRPKDASDYRVIYADLTVQDVPPANVPAATSTPIVPQWTQHKFGYDASAPASEGDLLASLRAFAEISDNRFPDSLEILALSAALEQLRLRKGHMVLMEQIDWNSRTAFITHGTSFIQPENGADWHYAGKGITLDRPDVPILWYRANDSASYRVIYADLSVRDVQPDDLPDVPSVLILATSPQSNLTERDLVESLRAFAECNEDQFPDEFSWSQARRIERRLDSLPDAERAVYGTRRLAIGNGLVFVQKEENGSDWHYAGKGVRLGQPGIPIFWYRPKDSPTYRVIDANLKVRTVQSDALPAVPAAALKPAWSTSLRTEEDLVEALRTWAELNGNRFPDAFTLKAAHQLDKEPPSVAAASDGPASPSRAAGSERPAATAARASAVLSESRNLQAEVSEYLRTIEKTRRISDGVLFAITVGARYAGAGVALNQPGTPICWYQPADAPTCRVIYADLSVRDVPPQDLPAPPGRNLLPLLRARTTQPVVCPPSK